ncbi:MAG: DEAD/DEAH box helicase [Candidatus Magnetomorum sp.]|nr:DEAD/DEAH box helicase [Candidatus Magnetomorum sp.]
MIPSILAQHVEQGIKNFLRTTFPISNQFFSHILEDFLTQKNNLFKGPYLDIQLPFQQVKEGIDYFPELPMMFPPYRHQKSAFDRLSGPKPLSTIVATGTGSGKTECFTYPILDHCFKHRGEPGIKAILVYPMNALATDQASRLAKLIHNSKLKNHVKAGIYIGQAEKDPCMRMTSSRLISDKKNMQLSPPDILLTNYKMLDYLLIRPDDQPLWADNNPDSLRFLVVDELHTFDGAQGADLGCLIRRLKARLAIDSGYLCCVGTSATLGSKKEQDDLLEFASAIFGEHFDSDAIISESRLTPEDFFGDLLTSYVDRLPNDTHDLDPANYATYPDYIQAQYQGWFDKTISGNFADVNWRLDLSNRLKELRFFQLLIKGLEGKIHSFDDILIHLTTFFKVLKTKDHQDNIKLLNSLLALISEARIKVNVTSLDDTKINIIRPFLNVRLQLWLRELARIVAEVSPNPCLRFADDLNEDQLKKHLPLVHCRECGSMGWAGLKRKVSSEIMGNLKDFYHAFFKHDPKVVFLFPEKNQSNMPVSSMDKNNRQQNQKPGMLFFCTQCLHVSSKSTNEHCPNCDHEELIWVHMPDVRLKKGQRQISANVCPYCDSSNSLTLMGSRAASLTSVMIVQLYSSTYNDDKKLLTFSDNVQDAAHRAGFFNSRTFRFNFRTALQKVILGTGDGKFLSELPEIFIHFWSQKMNQNKYIATFLGPNMEWLSEYDYLKKHGQLPEYSSLLKNINNRITWEIISEYSFQARIGRTLEKTSSSVAYLDPDYLNLAIDRILTPLQNQVGGLKNLDSNTLACFLSGIIVHLKNQGGIYFHHLNAFIENFGASYILNRMIWMPNFGPVSRAPTFLTTKRATRFDQLYSTTQSHSTWYQDWADKSFYRISVFIKAESKAIYMLVLKELTDLGILEQKSVKGDFVWSIRPQVLKVSSRVKQMRCKSCGHNISVAAEEIKQFEHSFCQRFHCNGIYECIEVRDDYYKKLYATGDVERIFAKEHTGLLKRDERESLESAFKSNDNNRPPWNPNLLSCTPTLEMGIDIGNLSSLILCSVPPAQANYLQRIGRSGRRDGNSLNLTVANASPHDLFFFASPEEMLAGHIESPGIFLDASAVLERQFTAFCFDKWIANHSSVTIPLKLGKVLNNLVPMNIEKFPHNFIHYIKIHQIDLFDQFIDLFKNNTTGLRQESESQLKRFVEGNDNNEMFLRGRIMNGLHNRRQERDSLRKKVGTLNSKIKKKKSGLKDKNYENTLRELNIEKSALQSLIKSISERDTFNFFTDEGLLPNYAFPEVGVMLKSLIYRKKLKVQDGKHAFDTWHYEYERPAASALAELAPANTFYAEGRKVKIDQVDMTVSEIHSWRFCNNCSHKEILGKNEETLLCPNCGSPMWSDFGQKRLMLKMRQVFASTSDKKSRISDDSDNREPVFYHKQMLVEFDDHHILDAYKVDADFPFGFDFLSNVDFCEINFGEKTEIGEKIAIAGIEMPRKGFSICRICGKVQEDKDKQLTHAFTCTARNQESDKNLIECIYLYRQFISEAIRILLPVNIISDSERKLHSFIAAMQLGLKKTFKGKIDHIQTTIHEEPLPETSYKRKYLVLYDTVPGGTGYLKQLMRSKHQLMDILELSLTSLKSCSCNQDEKMDGCYRCLFAYRNSYTMQETSRTTAVEMLAEILTYRDKLVKTENIREIPINTFLESELESRFLGALKQYRSSALPLSLSNDLVNGKPGYFLKIAERSYFIEPQVVIGELDGVSIQSRADFIIRSSRLSDGMKPIALFLDGFHFHQNRAGMDMAQRMAIVQSNQFHVWSLTWRDVENKYKSQNNFFMDFMDPSGMPSGGKFNELLKGFGISALKKYITYNSFDLLVNFLQNPDVQKWQQLMVVISILHLDFQKFAAHTSINQWMTDIDTSLPDEMAEKMKPSECIDLNENCLYGDYRQYNQNENLSLHQFVIVEKKALTPPVNPSGVRIACCLIDNEMNKSLPDFQEHWNGLLRLYNYYQFLPHSYFITSEGKNEKAYDGISLYETSDTINNNYETEAVQNQWNEIKELTEDKFHELLDVLQEKGWPPPIAGYELEGENGEIIASAEFAWESLKIVFLTDEEMIYIDKFVGWEVRSLVDIIKNPGKNIRLFNV